MHAPPPLPRHRDSEVLAESVLEDLWFGDDDPQRTREEASRTMAAAVGEAVGLKPFPAVAMRVMNLLNDPNSTIGSVREAIEQDAAIAARLLRLANSPIYATRLPCGTIDDAVLRLGQNTVRDAVAGIATMGMFDDISGIGASFRDHCAGVAAVARVLAVECKSHVASDLFLCGLLHDVGKLLSLQVGEISYETMDPMALETPDDVHLRERSATGYDHAVLGAHVLAKWNLPDLIVRVVGWHHQPVRAYDEGGDVATLVALLRVADRLEYRIRQSTEWDDEVYEDLIRDSAWSYVDVSRDVLAAMWPKLTNAHEEVIQALCG